MNFEQQDFSKLAAEIREKPSEASAIMSNHYNVVLAALDLAAAVWYHGRDPVKDLPQRTPGDEAARQAIVDLGDKVKEGAKTASAVLSLAHIVADMATLACRGIAGEDLGEASAIKEAAVAFRNSLLP